MKILIETIPHEEHRYPTVGDWFYKDDVLVIRVSKLSDWRYEALVAVHELIEALKCEHDGVTQAAVDAFDTNFEKQREIGLADIGISERDKALIAIDEPGDATGAPYRNQHCFATGIERLLASALDVSWHEYELELEALP